MTTTTATLADAVNNLPAENQETPPTPPPAAIPPGSTDAPPAAPKRGRGRPKKGDAKTPDNVIPASPKPPGAAKPKKKKAGPAPAMFSGGDDTPMTAEEIQASIAAGKAPPPAALMAMPAEALAKVGIGVGSAMIAHLGALRYGKSAEILALSADEQAMLEVPAVMWLKDALPKMTAGEGVLLILALVYVPRVAGLEIQRVADRKRAA